MKKISYKGYRFPPEIIQQAIWLYLRFILSFHDVEDLFAERITISCETVRRWVKIDGRMVSLWRAVDAEGEVLDCWSGERNKRAALTHA
jgi:putative transposase